MQKTYFKSYIEEHLPIKELSAFGEFSILPYTNRRNPDPNLLFDFNNLSNAQILRIIKNTPISLNYQYFSISTFEIENNTIVFFTQKSEGRKSSISQIFVNQKPYLIIETELLPVISLLIEDHQKKTNNPISQLLNFISLYEYK